MKASESPLERIERILADDSLDDESIEDTKCAAIEGLVPEFGWEPVRDAVLFVLASQRRLPDWRTAAEVIWGAALDGRSLPVDRVIALLHHRFDPIGDAEDDLVWSITSKLKNVDYLSDYKPLEDSGVQHELREIAK